VSPQAEAQTTEISLLIPAPVVEISPSLDITGMKPFDAEHISDLKPRLSRPLYLTHSALLI